MAIFSGLTFHYNANFADHEDIRRMVESNGGFLTIEDLAEYNLLPIGGTPRLDQDEYLDIRFIYDSIESRSLQEFELYFVSVDCPIPLIDEMRPSRSINPIRKDPRSVHTPVSARTKRPRLGTESPIRSDVPPLPVSSPRSDIPPLPVESYMWTPERQTRPQQSFVPGVPKRYQDPIPLRGRNFFSDEEDLRIIDFIVENINRPGMSPNGQNLWKKAERDNRFPGRTWQSLEGRYKKHIRDRWDDLREDRNN